MFNIELVVDWEDRIKSYDQKTKDIYALCFEKQEKMLKILNGDLNGEWTSILDDKNRSLKIEMAELDGNHFIRAEGIQNHDVLTCFRCYCNSDNRK